MCDQPRPKGFFLKKWVETRGLKEIAMDRKNKHKANKNKQSKYGKLYFIEHSSEYLSI